MELEREVKLREAPNGSHHGTYAQRLRNILLLIQSDNAENEQRVVNMEHLKLLQEEVQIN